MISGLVEFGRRLTAAGRALLVPGVRSILARSIREEQAIIEGRQLGLTDMDSREVIDAWRQYLRWNSPGWSGNEDNWDLIRRAMIARALREEWKPPGWSA
jgi:hypothetical protein